MLTDEEVERIVGATLVSADDEEIGNVETVVAHAADNRAAWAAVRLEDGQVLVPLDQARTESDRLLVRYQAEKIRNAPDFDGETLNAESAEHLYEHYGIDDSVLRDHSGFVTEAGGREQGSSRDPRGGGGADDGRQGHP